MRVIVHMRRHHCHFAPSEAADRQLAQLRGNFHGLIERVSQQLQAYMARFARPCSSWMRKQFMSQKCDVTLNLRRRRAFDANLNSSLPRSHNQPVQ